MTWDFPHFKQEEFACGCGCGWDNIWPPVVWKLEEMRAWANSSPPGVLFGTEGVNIEWWPGQYPNLDPGQVEFGIFPTSGCRCPAHNKAVGGAEKSWHLPHFMNFLKDNGTTQFPPLWKLSDASKPQSNHCALACDFQVKRREFEKRHGPYTNGNTTYSVSEPFSTPWTLDPDALRALFNFYNEIHFGGFYMIGDDEAIHMDLRGEIWRGNR